MILLLDHYDSFTYNLYQLMSELGKTVRVVRYDEISIAAIEAMEPEAIVLSPGPGSPHDKTASLEIVRALYHRYPMFGVCLGHQIIAAAFGATIVPAPTIKHGKTSMITHDHTGPFGAFDQAITAMRYHSLVVDEHSLHDKLVVCARAVDDGAVMGIRHTQYPIYGVQFHPESIGTLEGKQLLAQFFRSYKKTGHLRKQLIALSRNETITKEAMHAVMDDILQGEASESEIAALLMGLKMKGETAEEITALVEALTAHAAPITVTGTIIDNCGTGGDGSKSFNVSTTCAFVLAGAGVKIAKNGNRSVSSQTGSADVLEHLGIPLDLTPTEVQTLLATHGIAFMFAPHVHPKLKHIMKVRRDLKIPTIFNMIGPLTNPIALDTQIMGVYRRDMMPLIADVLHRLGRKRAIVINGAGYVDEASLAGDNHIILLDNGVQTTMTIHPTDVGLSCAPLEAIQGGEAVENAEILLQVLQGERGPKRDTVLFNSALAMFAYGKVATVQEGVELAKMSIDSGQALAKLHAIQQFAKQRKEVTS